MLKFTTSWDDGHLLDLRVAGMLEHYGFTGTFYVCRDGQAGGKLNAKQIRLLAEHHEIGAHTLTHPSLPTVDDAALKAEIDGSKEWLEDILGTSVTMFAYPYGHHDARVKAAVKRAGFKGARTTEDLLWRTDDPFRLSTSVQVHPFPIRPIFNRRCIQPFSTHRSRLKELGVSLWQCRSLRTMAGGVLRHAAMNGKPWFHLWGHSWSLEQYGLWKDFEALLKAVAKTPFVTPVVNGALISGKSR